MYICEPLARHLEGVLALSISSIPVRRRSPLTDPLGSLLARLAGAGAGLVIVGIVLGVVVVGRHGGGPIQGWDDAVWRWSIEHRGSLVGLDKVIAKVGDAALLGVVCVVLAVAWAFLDRTPRALIPMVSYLGGEGIVFLVRTVVHRDRPPTANYPAPGALAGVHETSFSFPSGHAVAVTAVFFASLGVVALRRGGWWPWFIAFCLSAFVADSRLLLGVHWFSDVALGMLLGITWGVTIAVTCAHLSWSDLHLSRLESARGVSSAPPAKC